MGNWYRENYGKIIFWVVIPLLLGMGLVKLCAHVDLIDPGMVYENMMMELEKQERQEQRQREQEQRDREHQKLREEEQYYRMMCEKYDKEKKDQGFDYYCKKD